MNEARAERVVPNREVHSRTELEDTGEFGRACWSAEECESVNAVLRVRWSSRHGRSMAQLDGRPTRTLGNAERTLSRPGVSMEQAPRARRVHLVRTR